MQRPQFRHPRYGSGPRTPGFRSPPPAFDRTGSLLPSPHWALSTPPTAFGPRFEQCSLNTPPREFCGNRDGSGGKYSGQSRGYTARSLPYESLRGRAGHQGLPRTSTPFGREREVLLDMEKYYKPSMLQDPWAELQPISVTETQSKCNSQQATNTDRQRRYYN